MKQLTVAWLSASLFIGPALASYAQANSPTPERGFSSVSLSEYVTKAPECNRISNLDLEMHAGFNVDFFSERLDETALHLRDAKIDVTGEVNDRLFYWYCQALNGGCEGQILESLNESIEYTCIGYRLDGCSTLTVGRQDVFHGGFEYGENLLLIYEYSDMNEYFPCYLTGIGPGYRLNESQEIRLQVANSRMGSMGDEYGRLSERFRKPGVPSFYALNWNGSFLDESIRLRYSVSATEQAQGEYVYSVFIGQSIEAKPVYVYFDVMYSRGKLDPLGLLIELTQSEVFGEEEPEPPVRMQNTDYLSLVGEVQHRLYPKWQLFAKGMYESTPIYKVYGVYEKSKYRTAWGCQGELKFHPMANDNLHIFLTAIDRRYNLSGRTEVLDAPLDDTARLSIDFIYRLPLY